MVEPKLDLKAIHNETDLLAAAIHIDRYVLDAMNRLDEEFAGIHELAMQAFKQLSKNKHLLSDKVIGGGEEPGAAVSSNLKAITSYHEQMEKTADTPKSRLQQLCACCDSSYVFYEAIAKHNIDEAVSLTAHDLASSALDRMAILKQALGDECGCED